MSEEPVEKKENLVEKKESDKQNEEDTSQKNKKMSQEELKERKKLIAIYFLSGLIALSILIFALVFKFFPDLTTGIIECTYYCNGNEIDILNRHYEKGNLEIFIDDKEDTSDHPKIKKEGKYTVKIKTTENEIDLNNMFANTSVKSIKMSSEKKVNIKNMVSSFENCTLLENFTIKGFDTSKVNNMSKLFYNNINLKEVNIVEMKTDKVEKMDYMFAYTNISVIDLKNFKIEQLINSIGVFENCNSSIILKKEENKENETNTLKEKYPGINITFI